MMGNDPVQVSPEPVDVRSPQALHPLRILPVAFVTAFSWHRAFFARWEVRWFFRIFTYGFHRIVRVLPYSFGKFVSEIGGFPLGLFSFSKLAKCLVDVVAEMVEGERDRLDKSDYFGIKSTSASPKQAVENFSFLARFFTAGKRLVLLEMRQKL